MTLLKFLLIYENKERMYFLTGRWMLSFPLPKSSNFSPRLFTFFLLWNVDHFHRWCELHSSMIGSCSCFIGSHPVPSLRTRSLGDTILHNLWRHKRVKRKITIPFIPYFLIYIIYFPSFSNLIAIILVTLDFLIIASVLKCLTCVSK